MPTQRKYKTIAMARETLKLEVYQGLRKHRGSITELARRVGYSREWVRRVLMNQDAHDSKVVLEASKLWNELEANEARMMNTAATIAQAAASMAN